MSFPELSHWKATVCLFDKLGGVDKYTHPLTAAGDTSCANARPTGLTDPTVKPIARELTTANTLFMAHPILRGIARGSCNLSCDTMPGGFCPPLGCPGCAP